jgi:streptogramin lyase
VTKHNSIYQPSLRYSVFYVVGISIFIVELLHPLFTVQSLNGRLITQQDLVTYETHSNYIKEFNIPVKELGLKGITTDSHGNVWFYHSTNKTSTVMMFDPQKEQYKQYNVEGRTVVNDAIINLAGGQLAFDNARNVVWFTDARTNSIGMLDIETGKNQLIRIPTSDSGPMGITISPDGERVWFTEITGNKIATLDPDLIEGTNAGRSSIFTEYPLPEEQEDQISDSIRGAGDDGIGSVSSVNGGPTLLTFDSNGVLWVTMSYSHDILRVEPWALIPGSRYMGISNFSLPKPDTFSPFGIAVIGTNNTGSYGIRNGKANLDSVETQRIFVSDHGSSKVILGLGSLDSDPFRNYISYWTSPSRVYPVTLPSQIVADKSADNVYFVQHGGNRISKIDTKSGIMTEYDMPTGPLSTALFLAVSDNGERVWFTEYAANKIAYLDTTIPVPFGLQISLNNNQNTDNNQNISSLGIPNNGSTTVPLAIKPSEEKILDVALKAGTMNSNKSSNDIYNNVASLPSSLLSSLLSLDEVELSVIGMTDSGLVPGFTYVATPQRINMPNDNESSLLQTSKIYNSQIKLILEDKDASKIRGGGKYTVMLKSSALESIAEQQQHPLFLSLLFPLPIFLDLPITTLSEQQQSPSKEIVESSNNKQLVPTENFFGIRDISLLSTIRILTLTSAVALAGYIVYARISRSRKSGKKR